MLNFGSLRARIRGWNGNRARVMKRRTKIAIAFSPFVAVIGFAAYNTFAVWRYSREYYETPASVAIVLGAGSANGKLSAVFVERINHAVGLFEKGIVDRVIFTGGFGEGQKISDSQAARDFAVLKGLPVDVALIEEKSTITFENLAEAKAIMDAEGMDSALIVSDPLHMRRAMMYCDRLGIDAKPSPTPTTMYRSWRTKLKLLMYESFFYNARLLVGPFFQ